MSYSVVTPIDRARNAKSAKRKSGADASKKPYEKNDVALDYDNIGKLKCSNDSDCSGKKDTSFSATKWLSIGLTLISLFLYSSLYLIIPGYEQMLGGLPEGTFVFMKVILNIYQIYLSVFILISVAIFTVYFIRTKKFQQRNTPLFLLVVFNFLVSASLFVITSVGVNI